MNSLVPTYPIIAEHPTRPVVLRFDALSHRYFACGTGDDGCTDAAELVSVTTWVKRNFDPFDAPAIAARIAARDGRSTADVLADWEYKRNDAAERGTRVHETAEDAILDREPRHAPRDDRERAMFAAAWQAVQDMRDAGYEFIAAEFPVFSERLGLAGTIDLMARDGNGALLMLDWKTNESIDADPKYGNPHGLGACAAVPDCNLYHYAMQLATYETIIHTEGYTAEPFRKSLLHVTTAGVTPIDLPDVGEVVARALLDYRINGESLNTPF